MRQKCTIAIFAISLLLYAGSLNAQVTKLQDYSNTVSPTIGTFQGITFKEAGFSGLYPIPNTNGQEFWTCSDRGVNIDAANANSSGCRPTYDKLYAFPSYAPKIHRIRITGNSVQILQTITIKRPNGTGATGIINPTGLGSTSAELATTDTVYNCADFMSKTTPKDTFGIDPEGILVDKQGNFWLCEEGGATIWKLNSNGVLMQRYTPYANLPGVQSVDMQIDTVFKYRKNNRGFEGISIAPNGKIYAIIQSPILYPSTTVGEATRVHRILEINPVTNAQRMLVYLNDGIIGSSGSNQIRLRDWKIGDMAAINDSTFLVLEAAARGTTDIKRLYQININQASAVHSGLYGGVTLEALVDSAGLAAQGIKPVTKTLVMDLLANGWPAALDKAEGLAILNDSTIAICNDNDFAQTSPSQNGIATATTNLSHVITYRLSGASKLTNYKKPIEPSISQGVTGTSSSQTPYLNPVIVGGEMTSIITTGDQANNGYTMAGTPDGLGAFDNNDGTFTLVMNHEFGNTAGVIRDHGSKGAFVSKWKINKNDLSVVEGSDLVKKVYVWSSGAYVLKDSANASSLTAFNRFCSADLPAVSAFYNAATGMGTQERIFMNGEESGAEGRAFGHIITGTNGGTTYELPALGKFSWENAIANPATGNKTLVAGTDDATPGQIYMYIGTKTNTGTDVDKAGLTNGKLFGVAITGLTTEVSGSIPAANTAFTMVDLGIVKDSTGAALNTRSNNLGVTSFLRPEDGAWDPSNPNDFYFATTNAFSSPSRLWRLRFTDIKNPEMGGTATAVLDGTEGQKMMDNIAIDKYGHIIIVEDVGNNAHIGKTWQYTIATDKLEQIAQHDSTRFYAGGANFLTQDEEASGVIDMEEILGAGNFLIVDQAHYSQPGALVEGGQLLKLYNPATANGIAMKSIAEARAINPNDTVRVQGIVTRAWGRFIYIQDSTGAIGVRQSSGAMVDSIVSGGIMEGDLVEVVAPRSNFNNYAQLSIATGAHKENNRVTVLAHNQTMPKAKKVTLKEINENGEMYESQLVKVVGLRTASTGNFAASSNYTVWDGKNVGDTMLLRVISGADTEIDDAPGLAIPTDDFTFEGTLIQFCATPTTGCTIGYQLQGVRKYEIQPVVINTIAEARAKAPNDTTRIRGIVTRAWGRFIYVQDSTGAIGVRQSSGAMVDSIVSGGVKEGDLVEIVGTRSNFNNYAQLTIATGAPTEFSGVKVLASNMPMPASKLVTLKELNQNGEMYESQLVKVIDLRTASTGNFAASTNYTIWDGTTPGDTMLLRVISGADTEIEDAPGLAIPSSKFTFEGTLIQFCATPTTGCTIGYQLQGVRKYEITAQPADPILSAFDLLSPSNNARVEVETGSTNPIQISWRKSNNAASYKWFATTATGSFATPIVVMASNNAGTDSILTLTSGSVDALLVSLGVARGDSALVKWTVFAYQNTGDSLKASQDFNVNLVRKRQLQGFGLISPANNTRLEVEENDNTPVNITWQASATGATYKWFVDVPTGDFSNPWAALASDVSGTATQLSLTSGIIDNLLASKSIADGDSVNLQWTVRAYTANDSLQANSVYAIKVIRKKAVGIKEVSSRFSFQLYPNPTSENAVLVIETLSKETVQVQLSDIQGKLIGLPIEQVIENGKQTIEIPSASLPNGLYFVNITSAGKSSQVKLVVMH